MGIIDNVGGLFKDAGDGITHAAEKTSKAASDAWNTAVEDAKEGANGVATAVRDADAKKSRSAGVDQFERTAARAKGRRRPRLVASEWWRRRTGTTPRSGCVEGRDIPSTALGNGLVQTADSMAVPWLITEWTANPDA